MMSSDKSARSVPGGTVGHLAGVDLLGLESPLVTHLELPSSCVIRERNLVKPTEQVNFQVTFVSICLKRPGFVADTPNMGSGRVLTGDQSGYYAPWVAICTIPILAEALLLRGVGFSNATELGSPIALFIVILVAATLCVITSAFVLRRAFLTDTHELVPVGLFFMSVSILPLAHGLTTPGVLYGENTATLGLSLIHI